MQRPDTLRIRTPEGIVFTLPLASPLSRALAWGVDAACIAAVGKLVLSSLVPLRILSADLGQAAAIWAFFAVSIGYGVALEWLWRGQTIGKRLVGLRVMDACGLRVQFSQIAIRNLLRFVDNFPMLQLTGGLTALVTPRAQRLGDLAANTIVVRLQRPREPDLEQAAPGKFNSLRAYPHVAARLRQQVAPEEATLAMQALLRRGQLEPAARVDLFRDIADFFKTLARFPEEATAGLSDEQYVRNVVDLLFRSQSLTATATAEATRRPAHSGASRAVTSQTGSAGDAV